MLFYLAELEVLGCHHGDIGGWLLEKWAIPAKAIDPIVDHHDFRPQRDHAERTAVVHIADILTRAEGFGSGGDQKIPRLEAQALDTLGMGLEDVEKIMDRMNDELSELLR